MPDHLDSALCDINYEGSSNAMEMEGAIRLWQRSLENTKCDMVSDGDSKAYSKVSESQCYGKMLKLRKLIVLGMFMGKSVLGMFMGKSVLGMFMGKRLMNLKSTTKGKFADCKTDNQKSSKVLWSCH